MRRFHLFAKGNLDLRDSLHTLRLNGKVLWNGINEIVRVSFPGSSVRVMHETWTRSDALLQSDGATPEDLAHRGLPLGSFSPQSQFSTALFSGAADAIVLSCQPDLFTNLVCHKQKQYLFYPSVISSYSTQDETWLRDNFDPVAPLDVVQSMENFSDIVGRCRKARDVPILIYNLSTIVPGDSIYCYKGVEDVIATRIKQFNLGLIELSRSTGVYIVDVDSIVARHGANNLKIDTLHFSPEGCRLVAEEVVRILNDSGCLPCVR